MEIKFISEFVPLEEKKIDLKLEKLRKFLTGATIIKRNLSVIEKDFDPSRAIHKVVECVADVIDIGAISGATGGGGGNYLMKLLLQMQ